MPREQDRWKSSGIDFRQVVSKPAEADQALTQAYLALNSFKAGIDSMQEIPPDLAMHYKQTLSTIDLVVKAQRESHQLRMMVKRYRF
jgi:hypothetical protein